MRIAVEKRADGRVRVVGRLRANAQFKIPAELRLVERDPIVSPHLPRTHLRTEEGAVILERTGPALTDREIDGLVRRVARKALEIAREAQQFDRYLSRLVLQPSDTGARLRSFDLLVSRYPDSSATRETVQKARSDANAMIRLRAAIHDGADGVDRIQEILEPFEIHHDLLKPALEWIAAHIPPDSQRELLRRWVRGARDPHVRTASLRQLAALDGERARPDLLAVLESGESRIVLSALTFLRRNPSADDLPHLAAAAKRTDLARGVQQKLAAYAEELRASLGPNLSGALSKPTGDTGGGELTTLPAMIDVSSTTIPLVSSLSPLEVLGGTMFIGLCLLAGWVVRRRLRGCTPAGPIATEWEQFAKRHGFSRCQLTAAGEHRFLGRVSCVQVELLVSKLGLGDLGSFATIRLRGETIPRDLNIRGWRVMPAKSSDDAAPRIHVGDDAFESRVAVSCFDPTAIARFDSPCRARLLALEELGELSLEAGAAQLRFSTRSLQSDDWDRTLQLLIEACQSLNERDGNLEKLWELSRLDSVDGVRARMLETALGAIAEHGDATLRARDYLDDPSPAVRFVAASALGMEGRGALREIACVRSDVQARALLRLDRDVSLSDLLQIVHRACQQHPTEDFMRLARERLSLRASDATEEQQRCIQAAVRMLDLVKSSPQGGLSVSSPSEAGQLSGVKAPPAQDGGIRRRSDEASKLS
ncbi:MAG: HEAT repeat domain-containing protein [Planctomycetes bacterium]|nr:HEAT repeat domain-containing protein [Planctomycetota bacterium]